LATTAVAASVLAATNATALDFELIGTVSPGDSGFGEIVVFDPVDNSVLVKQNSGVQVFTFESDGSFTSRGSLDFSNAFGDPSTTFDGASSTASDPLGRGFGAVSLIPELNGTTLGKVGFYDFRDGSLMTLGTVDVGFHPDSVSFSADGSKLFVANEGEWREDLGGDLDAPGSLSIIDLSGVSSIGDLSSLTNANVSTFDFTAANLGPGASLDGIRINDLSATEAYRHIEPEFVSPLGDKVYVSLQENNAIGVFDLANNRWSAIHDLGTITNTVDASDRDAGALIDDTIAGLPMPDTIASFSSGGTTFVVTANEGDANPEDIDIERVKNLGDVGISVDAGTVDALNAIYGDFTADENLGRLEISFIDGDSNGDGDIDVLTGIGTRSFSIWNAESGDLVFDWGSLENLLLSLDPTRHNVTDDDPTAFDSRSDAKGPEPEALVLGEFGGELTLFLGMERQHGILAFSLADPEDPQFLGYINGADDDLLAPESMFFIPEGMSPTGAAVLLTGFEENGGAVAAYSVVPIPAALPLFGSALIGLAALRRRRRG
jgi:hypothetical protein